MTDVIDADPLRMFIRRHFRLPDDEPFDLDRTLVPGIMDVFGVLEVADFIEEAYGIRWEKDDLNDYEDDFRSLRSIATLIQRKRTGNGPST
jgi:acyl carrier protein